MIFKLLVQSYSEIGFRWTLTFEVKSSGKISPNTLQKNTPFRSYSNFDFQSHSTQFINYFREQIFKFSLILLLLFTSYKLISFVNSITRKQKPSMFPHHQIRNNPFLRQNPFFTPSKFYSNQKQLEKETIKNRDYSYQKLKESNISRFDSRTILHSSQYSRNVQNSTDQNLFTNNQYCTSKVSLGTNHESNQTLKKKNKNTLKNPFHRKNLLPSSTQQNQNIIVSTEQAKIDLESMRLKLFGEKRNFSKTKYEMKEYIGSAQQASKVQYENSPQKNTRQSQELRIKLQSQNYICTALDENDGEITSFRNALLANEQENTIMRSNKKIASKTNIMSSKHIENITYYGKDRNYPETLLIRGKAFHHQEVSLIY